MIYSIVLLLFSILASVLSLYTKGYVTTLPTIGDNEELEEINKNQLYAVFKTYRTGCSGDFFNAQGYALNVCISGTFSSQQGRIYSCSDTNVTQLSYSDQNCNSYVSTKTYSLSQCGVSCETLNDFPSKTLVSYTFAVGDFCQSNYPIFFFASQLSSTSQCLQNDDSPSCTTDTSSGLSTYSSCLTLKNTKHNSIAGPLIILGVIIIGTFLCIFGLYKWMTRDSRKPITFCGIICWDPYRTIPGEYPSAEATTATNVINLNETNVTIELINQESIVEGKNTADGDGDWLNTTDESRLLVHGYLSPKQEESV